MEKNNSRCEMISSTYHVLPLSILFFNIFVKITFHYNCSNISFYLSKAIKYNNEYGKILIAFLFHLNTFNE